MAWFKLYFHIVKNPLVEKGNLWNYRIKRLRSVWIGVKRFVGLFGAYANLQNASCVYTKDALVLLMKSWSYSDVQTHVTSMSWTMAMPRKIHLILFFLIANRERPINRLAYMIFSSKFSHNVIIGFFFFLMENQFKLKTFSR